MTLRWEERAFHDRVMRDYRSRPQGRVPATKPEDIERPDIVDLMVDFLTREAVMSVDELDATRAERFDVAEELGADRAFAERFPDERELRAERFGAPIGIELPTCVRCGAVVTKDDRDRLVHIGPTDCPRAEPFQPEVPA